MRLIGLAVMLTIGLTLAPRAVETQESRAADPIDAATV